jgi:hypothetical protein
VGKRAIPPRQPDTCNVEEARVGHCMESGRDRALRGMNDTETGEGGETDGLTKATRHVKCRGSSCELSYGQWEILRLEERT